MVPVLSVSEFIEQINGIVAGVFTVEGEVSQHKISQGKWIFFDLKDSSAVVNCFASLFTIRTPLEDGMKVRITGYPSIYAKSGRFSFTVQQVELVGAGALKRAYELLKAKLTTEGLFAPERKRTLTRFPERVGVIASRDSAAYGDFKRILANRWGGVQLTLRHVAVQGESAVAEIVQAFKDFNEHDGPFDAIVLIRGGGSAEDLAAFNTEDVVRAIYGSKAPVVVGVGHERDETLADFVADVRASTPSNAAEILVPDRAEFNRELDFTLERFGNALEHEMALLKRNLENIESTLYSSLEFALSDKIRFVKSSELLLRNVNPRTILDRGYSITRTATGEVVRSAKQVDAGDTVVVELAQGKLATTIKKVE